MQYFLIDGGDNDFAVYEREGNFYPVFEEKYGSAVVSGTFTMSEVKEEKTCEALDKYMQPYREGKKKIYMAGPLFNEGDRYTNKLNSDALREKGYTTFLPQEVVITKDSSELVKAACFYMDLKAIRECDILIANCNGIEIDSGTAAEIGLGYGWNKRMIVYKSDVRNYYNEVFRLNNFVGGLTDNKVCSTLEEVLQMVSALKFEE